MSEKMSDGVRTEKHQAVYQPEENRQMEKDDFGSLTPVSSIGSPTHHSRETLQARVEKWSEMTAEKPRAIVYVATECFHVHKSAISRCGYIGKQLTNASVVTVNPPLNITEATFLMVAEFCYGADIVLAPENLAALRTASQLLEMTEDVNPGNLIMQTEDYFMSMVTSDEDYATIVLNSCVELMPEAETVANLVSRSLEVLGQFREGDLLVERVEVVRLMKFEDFKVVARKLSLLLPTKHDTLYIVIDQYIKGNMEKLTEEERSDLCSLVDCVKLEPHLLIHAVQCPRMPLRFIVRAMFADQINARKSIISATRKQPLDVHPQPLPQILNHSPDSGSITDEDITLGGILQRDAALRHVEQIKQEMEITSSKIKQLEEELKGMKTLLSAESESDRMDMEKTDLTLSRLDSRRCTSLRILTTVAATNRIQQGERGSISSITLPRSLRSTASSDNKSQSAGKGFGSKLLSGLKSVFRASGPKQEESTGCRVGRKSKAH
ncbi:hypothetical protein QQ045_007796 [Rhodiola kirilowii]